ncbi:carbohydrate ABC transporter permease [Nonomuraea fuscirosea]|uniref:Carbohydrate ABC transporter membrane protein 2 (CUT1 family) n=1 Tax=Nonomuraea fuscirosea TaxID=1291556 RepID=A0A2T0MSX7_9ACTN|nr:carbohydrate ABC transporter permease [Nonomuraea fuscirosea]PRX61701.1 carbohydrate ABC transporter membrane protein 2 (CUT1 family) [Nonomuraea fuscirosea]WSA48606.1 carbohydrate ABC transporter permease [Nonomuraea fuscirosea]
MSPVFEARRRSTRLLLQLVATLMIIPYVFPLVAMVQGSLAGEGLGNYQAVFSVGAVGTFFRNSAIIAVSTIVIVYVLTMLAAFGFSKLRIRAKEVYFWLILAALTLPEVVLLTPLFATTLALGVYDTYWAVVLPLAALQIPFAVLLTRKFIDGVPDSLFDAARVDGAGVFTAFRYIVLPMTRPIGAAIVVLTLIGAWNSYLLPLVLIQDPAKQTITLLPQFFVSQFSNDQTKVLASAVITAIPEIAAYLCLQGLFERGLAAGALK